MVCACLQHLHPNIITVLCTLSYFDNTVTTVSFSQSTYVVYEANCYAEITLVLSDALPVNVTIQINNEDITASKLCMYVCMYVCMHVCIV